MKHGLGKPLALSLWFDKLTTSGPHPELVVRQANHERPLALSLSKGRYHERF